MSEFTFVMRFNDIGTDDAIGEHQKIILSQGYCLGAWWHDETILPVRQLSLLKDSMKNNKSKIDVFFINSSKKWVYQVSCEDFFIGCDKQNNAMKITCPNPKKAPLYYRSILSPLWMKIVSIEKCSEDVLTANFSYCEYGKFLTSRNNYEEYDNTIIDSLEELIQTDRTLIFIRKRSPTDRKKSIINTRKERSNYPRYFKRGNTNGILLLSDLHFSETLEDHAFNLSNEHAKYSLAKAIDACVNAHALLFDNLILAGDFTWKASHREYQLASSFLTELTTRYNIGSRQLLMIPGNHDITFTIGKKKGNIVQANSKSKKEYAGFYRTFQKCEPAHYFSQCKRILLKNLLPVEIIGMNSNHLQQIKDEFTGIGFVGLDQQKQIIEEMRFDDAKESYSLRILVLHQHLMPIEYQIEPEASKTYSLSLDSEAISDFIVQYGVKLVVHGHAHKENIMKVGKLKRDNGEMYEYYVLSLGSAGVSSKHLGQNVKNSIGFLSFEKGKGINIKILELNNGTSGRAGEVMLDFFIPM